MRMYGRRRGGAVHACLGLRAHARETIMIDSIVTTIRGGAAPGRAATPPPQVHKPSNPQRSPFSQRFARRSGPTGHPRACQVTPTLCRVQIRGREGGGGRGRGTTAGHTGTPPGEGRSRLRIVQQYGGLCGTPSGRAWTRDPLTYECMRGAGKAQRRAPTAARWQGLHSHTLCT